MQGIRLKRDPFPFIFTQGDEVSQLACLAFLGLGDSQRAKDCLLALIREQRGDGSFPSQLDPLNWGMIETVRNALLLLQVGFPAQGVNVGGAVRFVLDHQRADGGWSENRALAIPAERIWLSNERSITWLTADAVDLLRQVGMGECRPCQAALAWLRGMQNRHGGWPSLAGDAGAGQDGTGDPDATTQIAFLIGEIDGQDAPAYLKGRDLLERHLDACVRDVERGYWVPFSGRGQEPIEVYTLTHLLLSWLLDPPRRIQGGYDVRDPRVRRMMEALVEIQGEDGGWRPFWMRGSSPTYTVLALKVLALSGALVRGTLQATAEAYVRALRW